MTTQENVDKLINMVNAATLELTIVQSVLDQMVKFLIQEKDAKKTNALGKPEMTIEEKATLFEKGICPDCGGVSFYQGPEGGMSQNIKCITCGNKFNVCAPFFAERI